LWINDDVEIDLKPLDATLKVNEVHTLTAIVYPTGQVEEGLEEKTISFNVICGANKDLATVTGITGDDGVATAKLTGTTAGRGIIEACLEENNKKHCSNLVSVIWEGTRNLRHSHDDFRRSSQ
jgi:hypothetical protein